MDGKLIPSDKFGRGHVAELERLRHKCMKEARNDGERYFASLRYGEIPTELGRWEEARDILAQSAQIALNRKNHLWLGLSHEKLGDLSASEED